MNVKANELQTRINEAYMRIHELESALISATNDLLDDLIRKWLVDELGDLADVMLHLQANEHA